MELIATLFFFAIYLLITITVITITSVWARRKQRRPWLWGSLAAVLMYNLVFWDLVPTLVMHKYYCDTKAGFLVYKTPEQWRLDNKYLTEKDLQSVRKRKGILWSYPVNSLKANPQKKVSMVNRYIYIDSIYQEHFLRILPIDKRTYLIADIRDDQRLAELISFGSGYRNHSGINALKFWLRKGNCATSTQVDEWEITGYNEFIKKIIKLGELK